jgi:hypothetical protein
MPSYYPRNCLAYHTERPLLQQQSIEAASCLDVAKLMLGFRDSYPSMPVPETAAIEFYQLAHAFALIQHRRHPHEPLPKDELELVEEYFTLGSVVTQRAFYYLVMICGREARHLANKPDFKDFICETWGDKVYSFICTLPDNAGSAMEKFGKSPPKGTTLGGYLKALSHIFYKGSWSGGFGGKKWGVVNDCAVNFVSGKYSPLMMIDTVWTLCHNNGPIFNKGMLFQGYHGNCLIQILDAQRAGMIPALIKDGSTPMGAPIQAFTTSEISERNDKIFAMFPDLPQTVDWSKVQELGAVLNYSSGGHKVHKVKTAPDVPSFEVYPGFSLPLEKMKRAA